MTGRRRPHWRPFVLVFVLSFSLAPFLGATPSAAWAGAPPATTGRLEARVVLVAGDLSLKPVPKQRFLIRPVGDGRTPIPVLTGFDGILRQELPPGAYRIESTAPVELEGKRFSWDVEFEIRAGATTTLELSSDNAHVETTVPATPAAKELDAGALYERFRNGVFKIVTDGGHGTGLLVSEDGLILTNHHVIADATFLAAKLDDRHKHQVVVVTEDAPHDVAVLRIHPDTVRGRPVLPLADDPPDHAPVAVGDTVVAIGNPLTTETILTKGVVSKVETDALYSDVNINPGNSGGPLLDHHGQVVGISTFGLGADRGPGLSGITRIHLARRTLDSALAAMKGKEPPSARPLPVESTYRFPPETVKTMALARSPKMKEYHLEAGKIDVQVFTPVLVASEMLRGEQEAAQARQKRRRGKDEEVGAAGGDPGQSFYTWQKNQENFRPVVRIRAYPEVKMTAGSAFLMGMTGSGGKLRFKTDFDRMELRRGDQIIEPIHPGRIKEIVNVQGNVASMKDIGYWGSYEYPPEAFRPGAALILRVWEQGVPEPHVLPFPDDLLTRVREDYRPYLDTLVPEAPAGG